MTRRDLLHALGLATATHFAGSRGFGQKLDLTISPLRDNLSVLMGDGGNVTILKGSEGLLITDSGLPEASALLSSKLTDFAHLPVKRVIDTHWHFDHAGGNVALGKAGAHILAQENVKKRLASRQYIAFMKIPVEPTAAEGLPQETFADHGRTQFAGSKIDFRRLSPAHTDGDTVIHFHQGNVLTAGDLFFNGHYPFMDYSTGATLPGMIKAAEAMLKMVDADTKIVPGHGPVATKAQLAEFREMLGVTHNAISKLIKQGKTLEQTLAAEPTKATDDQWSGRGFLTAARFVTMLYQGETGQTFRDTQPNLKAAWSATNPPPEPG